MKLYKILLVAFVVFSLSLSAHTSIHAQTVTPPNPPITADLYVGLQGEQVASLQQFLQNLGFFTYPTVTGYYGAFTRAAVVAFQNAHGIQPVGAVGPITRAKILELSNQPTTTTAVVIPERHRSGPRPSRNTPDPVYVLDLGLAGSGNGVITSDPAGISCADDCSEEYDEDTEVTLSATAALGSTFTGWSGGGCSGTGTCIVTMTDDTTVTATFTLVTYELTVTPEGSGTGEVISDLSGINCGSECTALYEYSSVITLTAASAIGSTFTGWSGAGCSGTGTCVVTMTAARTVTATFDVVTYTVGGTVSGLSGSGLVLQINGGSNLSISADGAFTFATELPSGSPYEVTVLTQPTSPVEICNVTSGSGTIDSSNITNVSVTCAGV